MVGVGESTLRVGRERDTHLVPPVHEDVGVMVGLLGHVRDPVDERHRLREVLELEVVLERVRPLRPLAHRAFHTCRVRIVSLVPSATEMLFALGVGDEVTAVTHECDHPPEALDLPKVTRDVIGPGLPPDEIDRAVRELTEEGRAIYELDEHALRSLAPDLIVTQALCAVCAVSYDDVKAIAERMDPAPEVLALDPHTLGEVLGDVRTLAQAADAKDAGVDLVQDAAARIDRVRLAVRDAPPVAVAALEWLDPIYVAGHWTPQLIEYAGGIDVLGMPGENSERRSWEEVAAAQPVGAVDAAAYFSRPGPRLIEGLELLGHVLHPDRLPDRPEGLIEIAL